MTKDFDNPRLPTAEPLRCRWCGEYNHPGKMCPWVKALEFSADGEVTRVEFMTPKDYAVGRAESERQPPTEDYPRKPGI